MTTHHFTIHPYAVTFGMLSGRGGLIEEFAEYLVWLGADTVESWPRKAHLDARTLDFVVIAILHDPPTTFTTSENPSIITGDSIQNTATVSATIGVLGSTGPAILYHRDATDWILRMRREVWPVFSF